MLLISHGRKDFYRLSPLSITIVDEKENSKIIIANKY